MLSADQVQIFLAVVDHGSFSAAARQLRRAQSAISYAIATLEAQLGVELFDRSGSRPMLTAAGAALLPDARKAMQSLTAMRDRGTALARGVEASLAIAIDPFCPLDPFVAAMADFAIAFPQVRPHLHLELFHTVLGLVLDGVCPIGIITHPLGSREEFDQFPIPGKSDLRAYVARSHPLAQDAETGHEAAGKHIQFILGDRAGLSTGQEMGILSARCWTTSDIRAQHALIRAGIGWGFLPHHVAADDLAAGRLVPLDLTMWPDHGTAQISAMVVRRSDAAPGPAATWLVQRLIEPRAQ